MKKKLFLPIILLFSFYSFGQITSIESDFNFLKGHTAVNIRINQSDTSGIGVIRLNAETDLNQIVDAIVEVEWGDGFTSTHSGSVSSYGISNWDTPIIHQYDSIDHDYQDISVHIYNANDISNAIVFDSTFLICKFELSVILDVISSDPDCFAPFLNPPTILVNETNDTIYPIDFNGLRSDYPPLDSGWYSFHVPQWWLDLNFYEVDQSFTPGMNYDPYLWQNGIQHQSIFVNCIDSIPEGVDSCDNVGVFMLPIGGGYYQGTTYEMNVNWKNYAEDIPLNDYRIKLAMPSGVAIDESSIFNENYTISGDTIIWDFINDSLSLRSENLIFNIPTGIADGEIHNYNLEIFHTDKDCDSTNNADDMIFVVGASFDPNDKHANQPYYLNTEEQDEIRYKIRFQNTGTAPAQDVYIMDTLSENLDWSTFRFEHSSHNVSVIDLGNGVKKFNYSQIWLPDSNSNEPESHGYIIYSIKEKEDIGLNEVIENTAYIFFDQNEAVVTNTTTNVNELLQSIEQINSVELKIFPNPSNGLFHIQCDEKIESIQVTDLNGRLVMNDRVNGKNTDVNLSRQENGVYLIMILTDSDLIVKRVEKI